MMAGVQATRRQALPVVLLGVLGLFAAGGAWLGIAQAPSAPVGPPTKWDTFVADTASSGTLAFASTMRTSTTFTLLGEPSGIQHTVERIRGLFDFRSRDEIARSTEVSPPDPVSNGIETLVVNGVEYQRFLVPVIGGRANPTRFDPWQHTDMTLTLAPFGTIAGKVFQEWPFPPQVKRIGAVELHGVATTEYWLQSTTTSCPAAPPGTSKLVTSQSRVWVDRDGRIRLYEDTVTAVFPVERDQSEPSVFRGTTITTFGQFGIPVNLNPPARVSGPPPPPTIAGPRPNAGCHLIRH
jgi:hypothetical protein